MDELKDVITKELEKLEKTMSKMEESKKFVADWKKKYELLHEILMKLGSLQ